MYADVGDVVDGVDDSRRLRASMRMRFAGESNVVLEKEEVLGGLGEVPRVIDSRREWNLRLVVAKASGGREEVVVVVGAIVGVLGASCAGEFSPGLGVLGEAATTSAISVVCNHYYFRITSSRTASLYCLQDDGGHFRLVM